MKPQKQVNVKLTRCKLIFGLFLLQEIPWLLASQVQTANNSLANNTLVLKLSKRNLNFAFHIYELMANRKDVKVSPFGISVALTMLSFGARNNTLKQMNDALELNGFEDHMKIAKAYESILKSLDLSGDITLTISNRILIDKSYRIKEPFKDIVSNEFRSVAQSVNFLNDTQALNKEISKGLDQLAQNNFESFVSFKNLTEFPNLDNFRNLSNFRNRTKFKNRAHLRILTKSKTLDGLRNLTKFKPLDGLRNLTKLKSFPNFKSLAKLKNLVKFQNLFGLSRGKGLMGAVLVSAIYFKGKWAQQFPQENTKLEKFLMANKKLQKVPMMNVKAEFYYAENEKMGSKILRMEFSGSRLVTYFVLPNKPEGLKALKASLTAEWFKNIDKNLRLKNVMVKLPKFNSNYMKELSPELKNLNIYDLENKFSVDLTDIADPKASGSKLFMQSVLYAAYVEMSEEGAAAVAHPQPLASHGPGKVTTGAGAKNKKPVEFFADHPFVFIIYDTATNFILFIGNVDNPSLT